MKKTFTLSTTAALVLLAVSGSAIAEQPVPFPVPAGSPVTAAEWFAAGKQTILDSKRLVPNTKRAKNVILFIGDGMGVSTMTAARILEGQIAGKSGEENMLSFEKLPYSAFSKTYSANQQTSDSAPTMTAMVTGIKTGDGELSVAPVVARAEPSGAVVAANKVPTILELARTAGKAVGIVSTARLTHATPAATYAHTSERNWEDDANLPAGATVKDIAAQMIDNGDIQVALGGGRIRYLPNTVLDPEYGPVTNLKGRRKDGRNLTTEWLAKSNSAYVWNKADFDAINPATTDHLLGLFEPSHVHYEADRANDQAGEPSITDMTTKSVEILKKNANGFFLMVEGGRIDHAHHGGNAYRALTDTIAMSNAVKATIDQLTAAGLLEDTLIVVSADHSHTFTIAGYPQRGNNILGLVSDPGAADYSKDGLGLYYTTLSYANGSGFTGTAYSSAAKTTVLQPQGAKTFNYALNGAGKYPQADTEGTPFFGAWDNNPARPALTQTQVTNPNYMQEALVPMGSETHAGEDVAIFARGPKAYLLHGSVEQNVIYHLMAEAFGF